MMKKWMIILIIAVSIFGLTATVEHRAADAAIASQFDPERIIDDIIFTNSNSMSAANIQTFLNSVNGTGSTCLKNYQTESILGNNTYGGAVSAATAIYQASQLYTINPQVLLVTLQKEQSLITRTSCPDSVYRSAMGFGCPDSAPCDAQWYGLSKQLYQAARHFRGYYNESLQYVPFKVNRTYNIGYNPNGGCGARTLTMQTRGTAALYSYTPYTPNQEAMNNLYSTGNGCSSYGNRNFWRDFTDWFGSPIWISTINNARLPSGAGNPLTLFRPIVGMAGTPTGAGYWMVASDGGIFAFGDAQFYGSIGGKPLYRPIVGMASTPSGHGYWLVASDGGIFSFGDAAFYGSTGGQNLFRPVVGMASTPTGRGYWLVASDGGIFSFGDAAFYGSTGGKPLFKPVVGMSSTPTGRGYWTVAADGGIFSFGDAQFYGSTGGQNLFRPVVGMASTPTGRGYWLVASDGGIFTFGNAPFYGSTGGGCLKSSVVAMGSNSSMTGYFTGTQNGQARAFSPIATASC